VIKSALIKRLDVLSDKIAKHLTKSKVFKIKSLSEKEVIIKKENEDAVLIGSEIKIEHLLVFINCEGYNGKKRK